MGQRYLIINADDFGIAKSADSAIVKLFEEKRITSASLMAPGGHAEWAAKAASEQKLPVGVHLTLNSDWLQAPWESLSQAESIGDENGCLMDAGRFAKQAKPRDVTREIEAQMDFMLGRGCAPDHIDSHSGTLYGINGRLFFINAFRLCRKYQLPFRFPKGRGFLSAQMRGNVPKALWAVHAAIKGLAAMMGVQLLDDIITNPYSIKEIPDYRSLADYYLRQVAEMGEGITEVFLHPAYPDDAISARTGEWAKREMEMEFLMSGELQRLIEREGIILTSWKDAPFGA